MKMSYSYPGMRLGMVIGARYKAKVMKNNDVSQI
jgi:hypothetical protein